MSKIKFPRKAGKATAIPLFGGTMWVFYTREDYLQAYQSMTGSNGKEYEADIDRLGGVVQALDSDVEGSVLLVGIFMRDGGVICHEALHVAQFTMGDVGANCNETSAYLTQWVYNFIYDNLPKEPENEATNP